MNKRILVISDMHIPFHHKDSLTFLEEIKKDTLVIDFKTLKSIKTENKYRKLYKGDYLFEYEQKDDDDKDLDLIIDDR